MIILKSSLAIVLFFILSGCDRFKIGEDVKESVKQVFSDKTGKIVINPQFDFTYSFSEGLAWIK